ncbi:hypothetical protein F5887DRAFT_291061 [Amanita rubescens]|nr:hypothetical protein F5887DRAFT_291061 [Amanita rubescens]
MIKGAYCAKTLSWSPFLHFSWSLIMKLFLHALLFSLLVLVATFPTPGLPLYRSPSLEPPPPAQPARGGTPPHRQDTLSHEPAFQVPPIVRWDIPNGAIGFWKSRSNPPMVISVQNNPPMIRKWHWRGQNYRVHPFPRVLQDFNRLNCEWTRLSVANEP